MYRDSKQLLVGNLDWLYMLASLFDWKARNLSKRMFFYILHTPGQKSLHYPTYCRPYMATCVRSVLSRTDNPTRLMKFQRTACEVAGASASLAALRDQIHGEKFIHHTTPSYSPPFQITYHFNFSKYILFVMHLIYIYV
jgi:hypothetical protein